MSKRFKVVCIDNKNRPAAIPAELWLDQEEVYTVVGISRMALQNNQIGFTLEEITLPTDCPYQLFLSTRFRPITDEDLEAMEAVRSLLLEVQEMELMELN